MPCFHPLKGYYRLGGGITFKPEEACRDRLVEVPCGQCRGCRIEQARQWALRCIHEAATHPENSFLTLTYNNEHLPPLGTLDHRDFQLFMKRLRKLLKPKKLRYFMCGEYGDDDLRPHYHVCLFNHDWTDKILHKRKKTGNLYISPTLQNVWGNGFCTTADLTYSSANYTARYVLKKVTAPDHVPNHLRTDPATGEEIALRPEYVTMSRAQGIGKTWLKRFRGDVYPSDEVIHNGRRFKVPRFYDNQLHQDERDNLKRKRRQAVKTYKKHLTPERLKVREKVMEIKHQQFKRELQ